MTNGNKLIDTKFVVLGAAMTLIGFATTGFQNGLHIVDTVEFIAGLILLAVYHHWFDIDSEKLSTILKVEISSLRDRLSGMKDEIIRLKDVITSLKDEIVTLKAEIVTLKAEIVTLKDEIKTLTEK